MRPNIYRIPILLFIFVLVSAISACQVLDQLAPSPNEQEVIVLPTLTPEGAEEAGEPAGSSAPEEEIVEPTPAAEDDPNAPPPLPATIPPKGNEDEDDPNGLTLYESPAGYQFQHPNSWSAADLFGQTIATNDPAVLENGELSDNQALLFVIAGSVESDGPTAKQLLTIVQEDVLTDYLAAGALTPILEAEPLAQGSAVGVRATYRLTSDNGDNLEVQAISLVKQQLYVVAMMLNSNSDQAISQNQLTEIMESIELISGEYLVDAATYGLTQGELEALEQELIEPEQAP